MKKVLFVCYGLGIGGIEKCLVNLINAMPENEFDIDLLLMNPENEMICEIKRKVNYIPTFDYVMNTTDTVGALKSKGGIHKHLLMFFRYCIFRILVKLRKNPWKIFKKLKNDYDIAIAYSQNDYSPYYVIDKVCAKRKVMWYHNGAYERSGKKYENDKQYYTKFDYMVAVSTDCASVLKDKFDFKENQLIVLKNICDVDKIKRMSEESLNLNFDTNRVNIATVGRLTAEKGADLAADACKILRDEGFNVCWHWIGDGNRRSEIERKISENGLYDNFILEGNQVNPYPYVEACDIYVQPSYYEAYSTTITEARVLCKPIVTTDVGGMRDQLKENVTGVFASVNSESISKGIKTLIENDVLTQTICANLKEEVGKINDGLSEYYKNVFE